MDFADAMRAVLDGKTVRRQIWDALTQATQEELLGLRLETPAEGWDPVFVVIKADGNRTPYTPSQTQMLARDWEIT